MLSKYSPYNPYFLIPFLLWVIVGGIALFAFDARQLFFFFNSHHTSFTDVAMMYITFMGGGVFAALLLLVLLGKPSLRNRWYILTALATNAIPNIIIQIIKSGVDAPRPLNLFNNAEWIRILPEWPRLMNRSFPSGHSTGAFCLFCFISFLLPARYQPFGFVFFILALLVGYSRMYLAAHFFLDVYVGSILGTVFTTVIFAAMNRYRENSPRID